MRTIKLSVFLSVLFFLTGFNVKVQDANEILQKLDEVLYFAKELFFANAI